MKIQYGCGLCAPESWANFDSSPTIKLQRLPIIGVFFRRGQFPVFPSNVKIGNIAQGLKVDSCSADLVYCSHVLEHLALEELRAALRETHRIVKHGGTLRFVLPDLEAAIEEYSRQQSEDRAFTFMESTMLGRKRRSRSLPGMIKDWLGGGNHLWMWDYHSMKKELTNAGFAEVRRAYYGDSSVPDFREIEDEGRWTGCLGIECRKTSQQEGAALEERHASAS
jgi:predicted SAM-dependent methyltransferase